MNTSSCSVYSLSSSVLSSLCNQFENYRLKKKNKPSINIHHPHHSLTLFSDRDGFICAICNGKQVVVDTFSDSSDDDESCTQHPDHSSYTCTQCNFDIHMECALFPSVKCQAHRHIQPQCHLQPMELVQKDGALCDQCFVCLKGFPCQSGPAFACTICKHFIHKSCAELSSEIAHPFHPKCHLFLQANHRKHTCRSCENYSYTFVFGCNSCRSLRYVLDVLI